MPLSTPHLTPLPFAPSDGKEIVVEGTIRHDAKRVTFSLCRGNDLSSDTAITFDIRFNDCVVVRNHFRKHWGTEDRFGGFPFKRGENCEVKFVVRNDAFQIFVNKQHYCDFKHCIEKEAARNFFIEGDFTINKISFPGSENPAGGVNPPAPSYPAGGANPPAPSYPAGGANPPAPSYQQGGVYPQVPSYPGSGPYPSGPAPAQSYPSGQGYPSTYDSGPFIRPGFQNPNAYPQDGSYQAPSYQGSGPYPGAPSYPAGGTYPAAPSYPTDQGFPPAAGGGTINNPPVPLMVPIPGGLYPGKIIYITGVPQSNPSRFTVNLVCGSNESSDYALHFDARFNYGSCANVVVRTHKQNGVWGTEERTQNSFPFSPGAKFELMILAEQNAFKIAVNNQHYAEFLYRIQPLNRIDHVNVVGDVQLTQVRFQ